MDLWWTTCSLFWMLWTCVVCVGYIAHVTCDLILVTCVGYIAHVTCICICMMDM
jgi:hypothetical protein